MSSKTHEKLISCGLALPFRKQSNQSDKLTKLAKEVECQKFAMNLDRMFKSSSPGISAKYEACVSEKPVLSTADALRMAMEIVSSELEAPQIHESVRLNYGFMPRESHHRPRLAMANSRDLVLCQNEFLPETQ